MCLSQLPSERLLTAAEEGPGEDEMTKDGSPGESKFAAAELHKSPASSSMLSGSSEDISDITEDRKPALVAMDTYASEDERKDDGSPGSQPQCSPSAGRVVFPEAVPVSAAANIAGSRASQRKPASPARYPLHSATKSSASWLPGTATKSESQPTFNLPENPFLLEPANLIHNLCASIPQLPPLYASLQALSQPRAPAPAPAAVDITRSTRTPSGSVDELTRALLDQLVKEGRLYRCEHCNILFPEISLYIFHRGCHGQGSPFQCHFCHTVCREKFEFMAHFMYCVHSKKP